MSSFSGPLPENIRRRMDPTQRVILNMPTQGEADEKFFRDKEKVLHDDYFKFLARHGLDLIIHAPMHKKSHLPPGWPDFTVFGPGGKVVCIEFKIPGNLPTGAQIGILVHLMKDRHHAKVCFTLAEATKFTVETFGIDL